MKILHINSNDSSGGAAIAAYRHNEAMRRAGIDSKMLVLNKNTSCEYVIQHRCNKIVMFLQKVFHRLFLMWYRFYATWSFNILGHDLSSDRYVQDADIIYIHWINYYSMSIRSIEKVLKTGKPVYWFMHDMWPITGGCHHSLACRKYMTHCGKCPMARNRKGSITTKDLSYIQFEEKLKRLKPYNNLHFLTPSKWLADCVEKSSLFGNHDVTVCRNVLDTDIFKPRDKQMSRRRLGLPLEKKLILFGADNYGSPYKGWKYLKEALSGSIEGAECVLYGICNTDIQSQVKIKVNQMGHISDIDMLIDLYNACDVFVTPSIADNFPNVILEAMACGLPCVGFNVCGIPELIHHRITGYVSKEKSSADLLNGIDWVLNVADYGALKMASRQWVIENASYLSVVKKKDGNDKSLQCL